MESNINVKPEPTFDAAKKSYPISNTTGTDIMLSTRKVGNEAAFTKESPAVSTRANYCFSSDVHLDATSATLSTRMNTQKPTYFSNSENGRSIFSTQCSDAVTTTAPSSVNSVNNDFLSVNHSAESMPRLPPISNVKPSEALFVRTLIGRCKRIAPLWFRGVSSMRERNREENRRMACNNGQSQNDWSLIALKIAEMNPTIETDAVSNLLKKLYKELPTDSVFWFLKCWLGSEDTLKQPDICVISRGDAKGRMRRIDGGKGSDKVWRLDTIVGMLYHGLPMSSTDTNIMLHTCDQELCVRPQHIRFRASSVALVVVLKALTQAGYTILPPRTGSIANSSDNKESASLNAPDESVDVFGPFTIDELQRYRSENLNPASESISKLSLNASDREVVDTVPVIKAVINNFELGFQDYLPAHKQLNYSSGVQASSTTGSACAFRKSVPHCEQLLPDSTDSFSPDSNHQHSPLSAGAVTIQHLPSTNRSVGVLTTTSAITTIDSNNNHNNTACCYHTTQRQSKLEHSRPSLKRPHPTDSPCSFPSSPVKLAHNIHLSSSTSPPLLISELPPNSQPPTHPHTRRPSDMNPAHLLPTSVNSTTANTENNNNHGQSGASVAFVQNDHLTNCLFPTTLTTASLTTTTSNSVISNTYSDSYDLMLSVRDSPTMMTHSQAPPHLLQQFNGNSNSNNALGHCYQQATLGTSSAIGQFTSSPNSLATITLSASSSSSSTSSSRAGLIGATYSTSGKSTPRQPAKKRPEARTPTIEGQGDELNLTIACNTAFKVHQNTPFVPVMGRSGRPCSTDSLDPNIIMNSNNHCDPQTIPVTTCNTVVTPVSTINPFNQHHNSVASKNNLKTDTGTCTTGTNGASASSVLVNLSSRSDEEAEMDQELVDIMIGRSNTSAVAGSTVNHHIHHQSSVISPAGNKVTIAGARPHAFISSDQHRDGVAIGRQTELMSSSPDSRRVIAAMVAALANSNSSPMLDDRNNGLRRLSSNLHRSQPFQQQQYQQSLIRRDTDLTSTTPPPKLISTGDSSNKIHNDDNNINNNNNNGTSIADDDDDDNHHHHPPNHAGDTNADHHLKDSSAESMQELATLFRNSPASGISQELIDMLANMAQQYGMQQQQPSVSGNRTSRPSSQVAQHFYRSLVNGSVCNSPFPILTPNSNLMNTNTNNVCNNSNNNNNNNNTNFLFPTTNNNAHPVQSAVNCSFTSSTPTTHLNGLTNNCSQALSIHHLRGLSFTPLSVELESPQFVEHSASVSSPPHTFIDSHCSSIVCANNNNNKTVSSSQQSINSSYTHTHDSSGSNITDIINDCKFDSIVSTKIHPSSNGGTSASCRRIVRQ